MKIYDWISNHASRVPEKVALVDEHSGRQFSYLQLHQRVGALAAYLQQQQGIKKGDRVAILSPNCSEIYELQFACGRIGAIFVPLNIRLTEAELQFMIDDLEPELLILDGEFLSLGSALANNCKQLSLLSLCMGDATSDYASDYETAIDEYADKGIVKNIDVNDDDPLAILYTSGTTGHPKGAILTHGMVMMHALNIIGPAKLNDDSVNLCFLPLFHTSGLNVYGNPCFLLGATTVVLRDVDPTQILSLINDPSRAISHFIAVPAIFQFLTLTPGFMETDFSGLITVSVGGSPISGVTLEKVMAAGIPISQGYGMTETGPTVLVIEKDAPIEKIMSCGKPVIHVEVKLQTKAGTPAATGEIGEVLLKGPSITPGYWRRDEANKKDFTDGWLHTGDAAYMDEDGYYYIVDRWKDMYISGGENVYPAEVEAVIGQLDEILEVAVIGTEDEKWGEVGKAFISLKAGATLAPEQVLAHCQSKLAKYKIPKTVVKLAELPHNATGKIAKKQLRTQA